MLHQRQGRLRVSGPKDPVPDKVQHMLCQSISMAREVLGHLQILPSQQKLVFRSEASQTVPSTTRSYQ